ncbi:unnamed protein product [Pleuronectes platessa]|uniref:Uncharacterized protein n=1 Tax=Pleuronectes platessa TaxID=8262 RepID=A0A9N7Z176_PLEPL|nr:unnamed protein product [Pleuronectes platessa]
MKDAAGVGCVGRVLWRNAAMNPDTSTTHSTTLAHWRLSAALLNGHDRTSRGTPPVASLTAVRMREQVSLEWRVGQCDDCLIQSLHEKPGEQKIHTASVFSPTV